MRKLQLIIYAIVGWYLLLITLHYFSQRPLWNDEHFIFVNIHERPGMDLFAAPLIEFQQFPRTYLYWIGQWSKMFDYHLLALRFLPFLCMTSAFFVWLYLAKKQIKDKLALLTFVLCWAASMPLIYYAAELKQYSMDVLAAAVFMLFLYHQKDIQIKASRYIYLLILVLLPLFGLFSYSVFFFLPLPMFNLLRDFKQGKSVWFLLAIYGVSCLSVFAIIYYFDLSVSNLKFLRTDWNEHMISLNSFAEFFKSLGENLNNLISRWFVERPKWLRMMARFFVGLGLVRLLCAGWGAFKRDGFRLVSIQSIAFIVFFEHLLLGILKKYPFVEVRTSLFFAPMLLFLTVDAIQWIKGHNKVVYAVIQYPFIAYLFYISLGIAGVILGSYLGAQSVIWQ